MVSRIAKKGNHRSLTSFPLVIILIVFLVRKRQQQGVFIQIAEPDYVKVAYGKELDLHFRYDCNYGLLENIVTANDKSFMGYVIDITEATELENVSILKGKNCR